jgi:ABC-type multidrug transport system fused ATPase/permease subunit
MDSSRFDVVISAWNLLTKREKQKLTLISVAQFLLGIFDLIGIAAIAMLGALSVRGIQSQNPGNTLNSLLNFTHLDNLGFRTQAVVIALFAAFILILKTVISVFINRKIMYFLSERSARLSGDLIERAFSHSFLFIKKFTQQELIFATTAGVNALTVGVIASTVSLASDGFLLIILTSGLFVVEPILSVVSLLIFASVAYSLHRLLTVRAGKLGSLDTELNIASTTALVELLGTYRESFVQGSLSDQLTRIKNLRYQLAKTAAELSFMPSMTKYVMEATLVLSALILGAFAFIMNNAVQAIAMLVLFMAAGFRIAPAVLRIQHGLLHIKGSLASARPTLRLAQLLNELTETDDKIEPTATVLLPAGTDSGLGVTIKNLVFRYPNQQIDLFSDLSLSIKPGTAVAIVGSSGAGKTSLADLILGVLDPSFGEVTISGHNPRLLAKLHPGIVGYVTQNPFVVNGSLRENLLLGLPPSKFSDKQLLRALELANLTEYSETLHSKLDTLIGDSGMLLSGGQVQRLGLARALLTEPALLVLDEATSALDSQTESSISEMLTQLRGKTTLIVIAHRLATIRKFDRIIYIDNGKALADGTFSEVRSQVLKFDAQAKLMGL